MSDSDHFSSSVGHFLNLKSFFCLPLNGFIEFFPETRLSISIDRLLWNAMTNLCHIPFNTTIRCCNKLI